MPVVGITGGIATGKSEAARLLGLHGAVLLSADSAAREVVTPGSPALAAIVAEFGSDMLLPDGSLDRHRLGALIFKDADARSRLNAIVHPPLLSLLRSQIAAARERLGGAAIVAVEAPLLFEAEISDWFDRIVVVSASEPVQVERLVRREAISADQARDRISAQWPLARKVALADDVIVNDGSVRDLAAAVDRLWERITTSADGPR